MGHVGVGGQVSLGLRQEGLPALMFGEIQPGKTAGFKGTVTTTGIRCDRPGPRETLWDPSPLPH